MGITRNNQQTHFNFAAGSSYTLASYAITSGSDRVLAVRVSTMRTTEADFTIACTFNGTSLSSAVSTTTSAGSRWYRTTIFYLVAPTETTADIVVTTSAVCRGVLIQAETLHGVLQTGTIGATATDTTSPAASLALTGTLGASLILAAVGSDSGNTPTWAWTTAAEDYDTNEGNNDTTEVAGSGASYETGGGDVTITATRSASGRPQAAVAAEFKAVPSSGGGAGRKTAHIRISTKVGGLLTA